MRKTNQQIFFLILYFSSFSYVVERIFFRLDVQCIRKLLKLKKCDDAKMSFGMYRVRIITFSGIFHCWKINCRSQHLPRELNFFAAICMNKFAANFVFFIWISSFHDKSIAFGFRLHPNFDIFRILSNRKMCSADTHVIISWPSITFIDIQNLNFRFPQKLYQHIRCRKILFEICSKRITVCSLNLIFCSITQNSHLPKHTLNVD